MTEPTGDPDAFDALVNDHADALRRYLVRRSGSLHQSIADVDDLLAEVLTTAWRRFDDIPVEAVRPWLYGVARRTLANARRRQVTKGQMMDRLPRATPVTTTEDIALADVELQSAMRQLSDTEREIIYLVAFEGLTPPQCAVALAISTNAASIRLTKAKAHLERLLDGSESSSSVTTPTNDNHGEKRRDG